MVQILGEDRPPVILGEDTKEAPVSTPSTTQVKNRDMDSLVVFGKVSDEVTPEDLAALSSEAYDEVIAKVEETLTNPKNKAKDAENISDIQEKTELLNPKEYFAFVKASMKNPDLTALEVNSSIKLRYLQEKIEEEVESGSNKAGWFLNFLDREFLRMPWNILEDVFMSRGEKEGLVFLDAITGDMSLEDFKVFLEPIVADYKEQGVFLSSNPQALGDLSIRATSLGDYSAAQLDRLLAVFDLATAAVPVGTLGKGMLKKVVSVKGRVKLLNDMQHSSTPATRIGAASDSQTVAEQAAIRIANATDDTSNLSDLGPSAFNDAAPNAKVRPTLNFSTISARVVQATKDANAYAKRALGDTYDEAAITGWVTKIQGEVTKAVGRSLNNFKINYEKNTVVGFFGHARTGLPISKKTAEKIAKDIPEAKVIPVDGVEGKYLVQYEVPIDLDKFVKVEHKVEAIGGAIRQALSRLSHLNPIKGAYLRDNQALNNLAERVETGKITIKKFAKVLTTDIGKLSSREFEEVGDIVLDLQSRDLAQQRNWMSKDAFVDAWKARHNGKEPSQKVVKGYLSVVDLSNYNYILKAQSIIRKLHRNKVRRVSVVLGDEARPMAGQKVSKLPDDVDWVVEATTGRFVEFSKYSGPKKNIFKVETDLTDGLVETRYIVDTDTIHALDPQDVLGYNAGGPRINPEAQYFVTFQGADGKIVKVALSTTTRSQATKTVKQLETLFKKHADGTLTDADVAANNSWAKNLDMDTVSKFLKVASDEGWDLRAVSKVLYKARDERVYEGVVGDTFIPAATADEFVTFSRRSDVPLLHYGGSPTYNENPLGSVIAQTNTVSRQVASENYDTAAKVSLGRAAKNIVNKEGGNPDYVGWTDRDYYDIIGTEKLAGDTDLLKLLESRKRVFELRSGMVPEGEKLLGDLADTMSEVVTGGKYTPDNPSNALTRFGFSSTFFSDPFQVFLQSVQSINIVAMAGMKDGIEGALLGRYLFKSRGIPRGPQLDLFLEGMGKEFGMTTEQMKDLRQLYIDLGRYEVDPSNLAEGFLESRGALRVKGSAGRVAMHSTGKVWDKVYRAGMKPFVKGEEISRNTGFGVAALKYHRVQIKGSRTAKLNNSEARFWITDKEQAYTLRMTQANKGTAQYGLSKVPLQFYSFMFRSMENIFVGRSLTKSERVRLAIMLGPFWGTTGLSVVNEQHLTDTVNYFLPETLQIGQGSKTQDLIKYGPLDALFQYAGVDTAFAVRVSVADGISQTLKSYREDSFGEVVLGAGGGKSYEFAGGLVAAMAAITRGDPYYSKVKLAEAFREIKVIDIGAKVKGIVWDDIYQTKSGKRIQGLDLNTAETIAVALGVPVKKVQEFYDANDVIYASSKEYKIVYKATGVLVSSFWDAINNENKEAAEKALASIESLLTWSKLTEVQKDKIRNSLWSRSDQDVFDSWQKLLRMGYTGNAERLSEKVINNE